MLLLVSKTLMHWLFNSSLLSVLYLCVPEYGPGEGTGWQNCSTEINLFGVPTLFLIGVVLMLLAYICCLCFRRPSGPQPSTYGHMQTLTGLINDWGKGNRLFWGDKGLVADGGRLRRAGTSWYSDDLEEIHRDEEYI